jgi:hypothetical protein
MDPILEPDFLRVTERAAIAAARTVRFIDTVHMEHEGELEVVR